MSTKQRNQAWPGNDPKRAANGFSFGGLFADHTRAARRIALTLRLSNEATMDHELIRNDDVGRRSSREQPLDAKIIRQLVQARCPELSLAGLELVFGGVYADNVLTEIADAVTDAIEVLEARLDVIEQRMVYPATGRLQ